MALKTMTKNRHLFSSAQAPVWAKACRLIVALSWLVSTSTFAEPIYTATYKGEYSGWGITVTRELSETPAGKYAFISRSDNFFAEITETSLFSLNNGIIQPDAYAFKRSVFGSKKTESLDFNWEQNTALFKRSKKKKDTRKHKINAETLDPALYQLQLQRDLYTSHAGSYPEELSYTFIKRKKTNTYHFKVLRNDTFEYQDKTMEAIVLERSDNRGKRTTIWILPELDFQIGRLVHNDDKKNYGIELTDYKADSEKLNAFISGGMDSTSDNQPRTIPTESSTTPVKITD